MTEIEPFAKKNFAVGGQLIAPKPALRLYLTISRYAKLTSHGNKNLKMMIMDKNITTIDNNQGQSLSVVGDTYSILIANSPNLSHILLSLILNPTFGYGFALKLKTQMIKYGKIKQLIYRLLLRA